MRKIVSAKEKSRTNTMNYWCEECESRYGVKEFISEEEALEYGHLCEDCFRGKYECEVCGVISEDVKRNKEGLELSLCKACLSRKVMYEG